MSDGNTSIPVAPVLTEGEMNSFRELFSKIANTITEASSLKVEFEALRNQVTGLTNDLEYQRSRNTNLDEALVNVRRERDEATRLLSEGRIEWEGLKRDLIMLRGDLGVAQEAHGEAEQTILSLRKERDEYGMQVLALTEERDALKASLARISEAMQGVTVHVTQELPKAEPVFIGHGEGFSETPAPNAQAELTEDPKPAERRKVYEGDPDFSMTTWHQTFSPDDYGYDSVSSRYWYYAS